MNLYEASCQWSSRPDDQRFWTLEELRAATLRYRQDARHAEVDYRDLRCIPVGIGAADLSLAGPHNNPALLTHWAFGQLAGTAGAPAGYLRSLPAPLAATNVNHGLARRDGTASLLIHSNGGLVVRSATSDQYSRIWDTDVAERLLPFLESGWRVPPARPARPGQAGARPATESDVLAVRHSGLSVQVGDLIAPAGLYASDHDMFIFMVDEEHRIRDGTEQGLSRGFFVSNSEVGAAALKVTTFLYRLCCGNHIVWNAANVQQLRIVHRGDADVRFARQLEAEVTRYADSSTSEEEARIVSAQRCKLGSSEEEVLDALFARLRGDVSRATLAEGYLYALSTAATGRDRTIDPNTAWGMSMGLTRYSQTLPHQDARDRVDRAAGKILSLAF